MTEGIVISSLIGFKFTFLNSACKSEKEKDEAEMTKSQ